MVGVVVAADHGRDIEAVEQLRELIRVGEGAGIDHDRPWAFDEEFVFIVTTATRPRRSIGQLIR